MPTYTATVYRELMQKTDDEVVIDAANDVEANEKLRMLEFEGKLEWENVWSGIIVEQDEYDEVDGVQRQWVTPDPVP